MAITAAQIARSGRVTPPTQRAQNDGATVPPNAGTEAFAIGDADQRVLMTASASWHDWDAFRESTAGNASSRTGCGGRAWLFSVVPARSRCLRCPLPGPLERGVGRSVRWLGHVPQCQFVVSAALLIEVDENRCTLAFLSSLSVLRSASPRRATMGCGEG
jgi:hypothetical protein